MDAGAARAAYVDRLSWLYGLETRGMRFELDRMGQAAERRGLRRIGGPVVHVAGTNGKGSVSAMVESVARSAGRTTGLFSSPHLMRYAERVRLSGEPLGDGEIVARLDALRADDTLPRLTFFEYSVLLALEAFRAHRPEVTVLEVGLGGRLDATNVVETTVSVITSIAADHTRILGASLAEIAGEKAGILRPGVPAVVGTREPEALAVIERRALELGAPLWRVGRELTMQDGADGLSLRAPGHALDGVRLGLAGAHQRLNAALAFGALCRLREQGVVLPDAAMREGLARVRWPGRLEQVPGAPALLFDCAHNPEGARALAEHLASLPRPGRRVLLFGALGDKDHEGLLAPLDSQIDARHYASPPVRRAVPAETFTRVRPGHVHATVADALEAARGDAGADGLVIVAGSIFVVAEARAAALGVEADPPIAM